MQPRAQLTQTNILAAATAVFARDGYAGARVEQIAEEAGVNKQRIYAYFESKAGLFRAVLRRSVEELTQAETALLETGEGTTGTLAGEMLRHYMAFHQSHPAFWRILAWANLQGEHGLVVELLGARDWVFSHLERLYRLGQERGQKPDGVSFQTFLFLTFAISFFYHANARTMSETLGMDLLDAEVRERILAECALVLDH